MKKNAANDAFACRVWICF